MGPKPIEFQCLSHINGVTITQWVAIDARYLKRTKYVAQNTSNHIYLTYRFRKFSKMPIILVQGKVGDRDIDFRFF